MMSHSQLLGYRTLDLLHVQLVLGTCTRSLLQVHAVQSATAARAGRVSSSGGDGGGDYDKHGGARRI